LKRLASTARRDSLSSRLRAKRFRHFEAAIADLPRPLLILDVGGTSRFWRFVGYTKRDDVRVIVLNPKTTRRRRNVDVIVGSGTNLPFRTDSFEIVFSNSAIEHVGTRARQEEMAREMRRVGKRYFVQSPNRFFPMEQHFYFPFFQFLPTSLQVRLVRALRLGRRGIDRDPANIRRRVESIRLLSYREMRALFPEAEIVRERFLGATKSFMAIARRS
jgi:Methyltransferase domain